MYVSARGNEGDVYFNEKGEKLEDGLTGKKKIDGIDMFITTDQSNLYGLMDNSRKKDNRKSIFIYGLCI